MCLHFPQEARQYSQYSSGSVSSLKEIYANNANLSKKNLEIARNQPNLIEKVRKVSGNSCRRKLLIDTIKFGATAVFSKLLWALYHPFWQTVLLIKSFRTFCSMMVKSQKSMLEVNMQHV